MTSSIAQTIAFIGGGNMASAIAGGLLQHAASPSQLIVVEPFEAARQALKSAHNIDALPAASEALRQADLVIWAVKPQVLAEAAQATAHWTQHALHLSVAAGIPTQALTRWLGTERIVRAMPNTPALIGKGMTGLFARAGVQSSDRSLIEQVLAGTGNTLWVDTEAQLDAVTALSGSGPAYVFYFLEAMTQAGEQMGLSTKQALNLAISTFTGAAELAQRSDEAPSVLRERVTSKGGTTFAALESMRGNNVAEHITTALKAAEARSKELGAQFGA